MQPNLVRLIANGVEVWCTFLHSKLADDFTEALKLDKFEVLREKLGIVSLEVMD
jgi:hypothetical protein